MSGKKGSIYNVSCIIKPIRISVYIDICINVRVVKRMRTNKNHFVF